MTASDAVNGEQFRMHTNIGPQSGSQGTLFQGGYPKNWPRGYTPERMHEVVNATVHSGLDPSTDHPSRSAETAQVRNTVARSTVPVEHLRDVSWYNNSSVTEGGTRGKYIGAPRNPTRAQIHIASGAGAEMTPIHEIGHHVSATVDKNLSAQYDSPSRRGAEEGYAENYAETHFRDRRGNRQASKNVAGNWAYGDYEKKHGDPGLFSHAFNTKRMESPVRQEAAAKQKAEEHAMMHPAPTGIHGQLPLLDRITHREGGLFGDGPDVHRWDYTMDDQKSKGLKRERG